MIIGKWLWRNPEFSDNTADGSEIKKLNQDNDNKITAQELANGIKNIEDQATLNALQKELTTVENKENKNQKEVMETVEAALMLLVAGVKKTIGNESFDEIINKNANSNERAAYRTAYILGHKDFDSAKTAISNEAKNILDELEVTAKRITKEEQIAYDNENKQDIGVSTIANPTVVEIQQRDNKSDRNAIIVDPLGQQKQQPITNEITNNLQQRQEKGKKGEQNEVPGVGEVVKKDDKKVEEGGGGGEEEVKKEVKKDEKKEQRLAKKISAFNIEKSTLDNKTKTYESATSTYEAVKNKYELAKQQTVLLDGIDNSREIKALEEKMKKAKENMDEAGKEKQEANKKANKKLEELVEKSGELGQQSQEAVTKTKEKTEKTINKTQGNLTQMNEKYTTDQNKVTEDITTAATELNTAASNVANSSNVDKYFSASKISKEKGYIASKYLDAEDGVRSKINDANEKIEAQGQEISQGIQSVIDSYSGAKNAMQGEYNKLAANKKLIDGVIGGVESRITSQKQLLENITKKQTADNQKLAAINILRSGDGLVDPVLTAFNTLYPKYNSMEKDQQTIFLQTESNTLIASINKIKATLEGTKDEKGKEKTKPLSEIIKHEEESIKKLKDNNNYKGLETSMVSILGDIQGYEKNIDIKSNELKKNNLEKDIKQLQNGIKEQDAYISARETILTNMNSKIAAKESEIKAETDQTKKSSLINQKDQLQTEKGQFEKGLNELRDKKKGMEITIGTNQAQLDAVNVILKTYSSESQGNIQSNKPQKKQESINPLDQFNKQSTSRLQKLITKSPFSQ